MKIFIKKEGMTKEMLTYLGYRKTEKTGDTTWNVGRVGMPHPDIDLLWEPDRYKEALQDLIKGAGLSEAALARMLLTDLSGARQITSGKRPVSDTDLEIMAGIFSVEAAPLREGIIRKLPDLEEELSVCRKLTAKLKRTLEDRLGKAEKLTGNERFFVKPAKEEGYLIFDAALMDFVKQKDGTPVLFSSPVAALDVAFRLEKERPSLVIAEPSKEQEMLPAVTEDFITRTEDGLTYYYDRTAFDPDGSERLLAVRNRDGDIAVAADLSEEEEDRFVRRISGLPEKKEEPKKQEALPVVFMQ